MFYTALDIKKETLRALICKCSNYTALNLNAHFQS